VLQNQQEKLITEHQGLVKNIALQYQSSLLPLEDLIQEGMLGLLYAIQHFDAEKGAKFSTYATYWIRKFVLDAVQRESAHNKHTTPLDELHIENLVASIPSGSLLKEPKPLQLPNNMPELEMAVLRLSYEQKKTISQIAQDLHISNEKVRRTKQKALRRLGSQKNLLFPGK
jgi:RNA polymerase sigma factor (sigma-70 family)